MRDLNQIIKAYDVRGTYPDQLDAELARQVGAAFAHVVGAARHAGGPGAVVIGHDMRPSGPELVAAFADGVMAQGCDVIEIGLASTDGLYFASGHLDLPGAMFTASHNPARYNGIKLCRAGAAPVGQETGLNEIKQMINDGWQSDYKGPRGTSTTRSLSTEYANHLRKLVDISAIRHLKVVVDAGNGMGGFTVPIVLEGLPLDVIPMYFELDGSFPNHEANPIDPENLRDLQAAVIKHGADIGLAFDGDADRCFVVDEKGGIVSPSTLTALIADRELKKHPGATVIHNLITSWAVPEIVRENGGTPVRTRVGHSFIKATMAETDAVFGGEHSGHFYFRDFWKADSGMLAALHAMAALGETAAGTNLSDVLKKYSRYVESGEINSRVENAPLIVANIKAKFAHRDGVTHDELDGLTIAGDDWWFNVRASNTEPLLRLNAEAKTPARVKEIVDEVLEVIRG
jgi:phosphomannomutase